MKIAVCVKHVPDATVTKRIDPQTKRLDRSGEGALNQFDTQAVEEALQIKERDGDGEVVLVSMGPERALDSLRKALAMGADRAVLVSDEQVAGSDLVATSRVLAAVLEREGADLVVFGQQGGDSDGAVLGAAVADRLRRPVISQVAELEIADGKVKGKRQTEFGYDVIEAPLPAVVAVSDAINEPRYPSLKGIMGAKKKPQETVSAGDLGVEADNVGEAGSRTSVVALERPAAARRCAEDRGRRQRRREDRRLPRRTEAAVIAVFLEHHEGELQKGRSASSARLRNSETTSSGSCSAPGSRTLRPRRGGSGQRRSSSRTIPPSRRRSRSRGSTPWPTSFARRASTPCSSRPPCSRPTSPRAWRPGSTPA